MIVAICDDNSVFRKRMHEFLVEYKKSRRLHMDIVEFANGKNLLEYEYPLDIVYMDYDMPILDGMECARKLRERKSACCIIFVTSFPEHVFDAFEVNTYRYLVKPIDFSKLELIIDNYIKERKMLAPIILNIDGEQLTISSEDVMYLEADGKYCNIRTQRDYLHSSKTLSQVLELLPQHCFYRTHKSYAVNFYCIVCIKENIITLTNGEKIAVSRNNISAFKKAYKEFIKYFVLKNH